MSAAPSSGSGGGQGFESIHTTSEKDTTGDEQHHVLNLDQLLKERVAKFWDTPSTLEDEDDLLSVYRKAIRAAPWSALKCYGPETEATILKIDHTATEKSYIRTVQTLEELMGTLTEIVHTDPITNIESQTSLNVLVLVDPSREDMAVVGGYLNVPQAFFAAHVFDGISFRGKDCDSTWTRAFENPRAMRELEEIPGSSKLEWCRTASCLEKPPASLFHDHALENTTRSWTRGSVDKSFYPYDLRQNTTSMHDHIVQNTIRQCWATGRGNEVMFREKISMFQSNHLNSIARSSNEFLLVLVDQPPKTCRHKRERWMTLSLFPNLYKKDLLYSQPEKWPLVGGSGKFRGRESHTANHIVAQLQATGNVISKLFLDRPLDSWFFACHFEQALIRSVSGFWETTLWNLNSSLDHIETAMAEGNSFPQWVNEFRYNLGIMRVYVPKMKLELQATLGRLKFLSESLVISELTPAEVLDDVDAGIKTYTNLLDLCESVIKRSEKVTQGLMAAMSIAESKNAIQQGHEVQKLTELAFVFIPMSFAASYFGMEVQDWTDKQPRLWTFWVMAICLVLGIYLLRTILYSSFYRNLKLQILTDREKSGQLEKTRIRDILKYYLWTNEFSCNMFFFAFVITLPLVLLWIFRPDGSPKYIFLTVTFLWIWIAPAVLATIEDRVRGLRDSSKWNNLADNLVLAAWAGVSIAYPPLMVYFGDIGAVKEWGKGKMIAVAFSGLSFVIGVGVVVGYFALDFPEAIKAFSSAIATTMKSDWKIIRLMKRTERKDGVENREGSEV